MADDCNFYVNEIRPKVIICEARHIPLFCCALKKADHFGLIGCFDSDVYNGLQFSYNELLHRWQLQEDVEPDQIRSSVPNDNAVAAVLFTSGTSSRPRPIRYTHTMLMLGAVAPIERWSINTRRNERIFDAFPLHCYTYFWGLAASVRDPGLVRVIPGREPITIENLEQIIHERQVQHCFLSVPALVGLVHHMLATTETRDLTELRSIRTQGASVAVYVQNALRDMLPNVQLHCAYSITELGGAVAATTDRPACDRVQANYVGRLLCGTSACVIDSQGVLVTANKLGELCVRKEACNVIGGYISVDTDVLKTRKDGYTRTGDKALITADGKIYVIGRYKDMFLVDDRPFAPIEIEQFIMQTFIDEVSAVVVADVTDQNGNMIPAALVVLQATNLMNEWKGHDRIKKAVRDRFVEGKHLKGGVYCVKRLPLALHDKVQRNKAREKMQIYYNRECAVAIAPNRCV